MQKIKTYVLIVSQTFPKSHGLAGHPTGFIEAIKTRKKQTTIRGNHDLWEKRIEEVQEGKAVLSIRSWTGRPYNSKQVEHLQLGKDDGVGIDKLTLGRFDPRIYSKIDKDALSIDFTDLARNDGLSWVELADWFKNTPPNQPLAIIYLTSFRHEGKPIY